MFMYSIVSRLIKFASMNLELKDEDASVLALRLYKILGLEPQPLEETNFIDSNIKAILDDLYKKMSTKKVMPLSTFNSLCDELMDIITPLPSNINSKFNDLYHFSFNESLSYLYKININSNYICYRADYQDEWINYEDNYKFKYILSDLENYNVVSNNKRSVKINTLTTCSYFSFMRNENLPYEFSLDINSDDEKERLLIEYDFLKQFSSLFIGNSNKGYNLGALKELNFFEHKSSDMIVNNFFPNTSIEIYDHKFNTLVLRSDKIDELVDCILYVKNTWKIIDSNNYAYSYVSLDGKFAICHLVLLNKELKDMDNIFINNITDDIFLFTGNVVLDYQIKKDISKLANVLSDESFDLEWYLDANKELIKYKELIVSLIDRKEKNIVKNEAVSQIQNAISDSIDNALKELIIYNDNEEFKRFLNLLK